VRNIPWFIVYLLSVLVVILGITGYLYYKRQISEYEEQTREIVKSIAELKTGQISDWERDKLEEAANIMNNRFNFREIDLFIKRPDSKEIRNSINYLSKSLVENSDYQSIHIIDLKGNEVYAYPENSTISNVNPDTIKSFKQKIPAPSITDLYIDNSDGKIYLNLLIPLLNFDSSDSLSPAIGLLIIKLNPEIHLYPLIQFSNSIYKTSEIEIIKKENDSVLFLNDLKFVKNSALKYKLDFKQDEIIAVQALKEIDGNAEGKDYRGVEVFAYISEIPITNWHLIAKIDKDEILAPVKTKFTYISLLIILIIFSTGAVLFVGWKNQQTKFYKREYETELEKKALNIHYEYLNKYANDIIILMNSEFDVIDINDKALALYGYSKEELLKLNLRELRAPETLGQLEEVIETIKVEGGMIFETRHMKKDRTTFPVEISSRIIRIEGILFYQSIVRDITERKKAEHELKNINRLYNLLSNINEEIVRVGDEKKLIENLVNISTKTGEFKTSMIGILDDKNENMRLFRSGINPDFKEDTIALKDNKEFNYPLFETIKNQTSVCNNDLQNEQASTEKKNKLAELGFGSSAAFPLKIDEEMIGVFAVYSETKGFFNETELSLLQRISQNIAFAIENLRNEEKRKEAEYLLRASESRLRAVFEGANDAMLVLDGDTFVEFNKAAESIFGLDRETLMNKKPWELSPPNQEDGTRSKTKAIELINSALSGKTEKFIWIHLKNPAEPFYGEIILNAFYIEDKKYLMTIIRDVTEDLNNEKELQKNREQIDYLKQFYENILESIIDGVWVTDKADNIIYVNSAMVKIANSNIYKVLETNVFDDKLRESLLYFKAYYLKAKKSLNPVYYDSVPIKEPNGKKTFQSGWLIPLIEKGKYNGMICSSQEVSDKIASIDEIRKLSRALEQSPALVLIMNLNGEIEFINSKFTETTGYEFEEVKGKKFDVLKSGYKSDEYYDILWDNLKSGEEFRGEFLCKKKNGELFWVDSIYSPIRDEKGITSNYLAVKEDITEGKKIEVELIVAKDKAEEMNRLKSSFLANMSHELRTPMSAILGFAELLSERLTDPELKEMSKIILHGGTRLTNTLNSILDLSRIEANKFDISLTPLNIIPPINETMKLFEAVAESKGIKMELISPWEKCIAEVDDKLLRQVFNNLLNNALKFTEVGKISVLFDAIVKDDFTQIIINVKDTGIGIRPEKLNIIFEPFRQVSEGLSRVYEGTGLGLTLTKKFVEAMNGEISVESEVGVGTTFTLKFKMYDRIQMANEPLSKKSFIKSEGKSRKKSDILIKVASNLPNVLIVEDDLINLKAMKIFLKNLCNTDDTENGFEAIELAGKNKYDLILMDIGLKGLDGLEAAKEIKKIPGYENTPIVAVTAFAMAGDKEKILQYSCSHYISKPFEKEELVTLVKQLLNLK
jgi:PAS domain S-box-containing protein